MSRRIRVVRRAKIFACVSLNGSREATVNKNTIYFAHELTILINLLAPIGTVVLVSTLERYLSINITL